MIRCITSAVFQLRKDNIISLSRVLIHKEVPRNFSENVYAETEPKEKGISPRVAEFRKKMRETTPITDLGEQREVQRDDALLPWPNNTNPHTGEVGGPKGPEPTRYGDWERKGRVSDF